MIWASGRTLMLVAALGSSGLLAGAFAFQHIGGLAPCTMCLWQRWPHAVAIGVGAVAAVALVAPASTLARPLATSAIAVAGALTMLVSAALGVLHTGVERAWWTVNLSCTGGAESLGSMDINTLLDPTQGTGIVLCTEVAWSMLGLSMASWNAIASLVLLVLWARGARFGAAAHPHSGL